MNTTLWKSGVYQLQVVAVEPSGLLVSSLNQKDAPPAPVAKSMLGAVGDMLLWQQRRLLQSAAPAVAGFSLNMQCIPVRIWSR